MLLGLFGALIPELGRAFVEPSKEPLNTLGFKTGALPEDVPHAHRRGDLAPTQPQLLARSF